MWQWTLTELVSSHCFFPLVVCTEFWLKSWVCWLKWFVSDPPQLVRDRTTLSSSTAGLEITHSTHNDCRGALCLSMLWSPVQGSCTNLHFPHRLEVPLLPEQNTCAPVRVEHRVWYCYHYKGLLWFLFACFCLPIVVFYPLIFLKFCLKKIAKK